MDPTDALAELADVSTQLEAGVLVDESGRPVASTPGTEDLAEEPARIAPELARRAEDVAPDASPKRLTQLEVATPEGSVFVVRGERRLIAATTGPLPAAGLMLHDLRTALRKASEGEGDA